jgi:uncharacterized protein YndB with AHSA1/START domain
MSSWRQQALIQAPPEAVWSLLGDPKRYPEWAGYVVEVTGLPVIEKDAEYEQVSSEPWGRVTTKFTIDRFEEMHEIRMRCLQSGWYSQWLLTEAQGATFVDAEIGIEPTSLQYRLVFGALGKRHFRHVVEESLAGLRDALKAEPASAAPAARG